MEDYVTKFTVLKHREYIEQNTAEMLKASSKLKTYLVKEIHLMKENRYSIPELTGLFER
jgi:hypothetical protein